MVKYKTDPVWKTKASQNNNIELYRAFCSSLLHAIIAHNHLPFFKTFLNFVYFCLNFQIFCPILTFFYPFLSFFWKIACMPLLSRIGPGIYKYILFSDFEEYVIGQIPSQQKIHSLIY